MLEIKNAVIVVVCIFIKYDVLCGGLADSNYFYTEEPIPYMNNCVHVTLLHARYVHDRNCACNL